MKYISFKEKNYILLAIMLLALLVRGLFFSKIDVPFFDERPHISASHSYVEKGFIGTFTWYHPNLRNILLYTNIFFFGNNPVGWRLLGLSLGTLSVYGLYLLAFTLSKSRKIALISAFLLSIDPLHISQSRVNPDEPMIVFFFIFSLYFALRFREKEKSIHLIVAGIFLGMGLAIKWYNVLTIFITMIICLSTLYKKNDNFYQKVNRLIFIFLSIAVVPVIIYLVTYYPWFGRGYSITDLFWLQMDMYIDQQSRSVSDFKTMSLLDTPAPINWFIIPNITGLKIVWPWCIIMIPFVINPFVGLLILPSVAYQLTLYMKERLFSNIFIFGVFLVQYTPFLFVNRPLFIHSSMFVLPVGLIAVASFLAKLSKTPRGSTILNLYLFINLCLVLLFLPIIISYPIPIDIYTEHFSWLDKFFH